MWPSLETASFVSTLANWALVASLGVGVVATLLIVWMGNVKEAYWDADRQYSRERVVSLESGMSEANARVAEAVQKTSEAELALERLRQNQMPRRVSSEHITELSESASRFSGQRFTVTSLMGDDEGRDLAMQIVGALDKGGWDHDGPRGIRRAVRTDHPIGSEIEVSPIDTDSGRVPAAAVEMMRLFVKYGLMAQPILTRIIDPQSAPSPGTFGLLIGTKPPLQ
jgi:hypothetical protein